MMPPVRFRISTIMTVVAIIAVVIAFLPAITVLLRETSVRIVGSDVVIYRYSMKYYADGNGRRAAHSRDERDHSVRAIRDAGRPVRGGLRGGHRPPPISEYVGETAIGLRSTARRQWGRRSRRPLSSGEFDGAQGRSRVHSRFDPLQNLEHKTRAWLAGQLLRALLATADWKANRIGIAVERVDA